jgi:uncharacterized Zn-finger protein
MTCYGLSNAAFVKPRVTVSLSLRNAVKCSYGALADR